MLLEEQEVGQSLGLELYLESGGETSSLMDSTTFSSTPLYADAPLRFPHQLAFDFITERAGIFEIVVTAPGHGPELGRTSFLVPPSMPDDAGALLSGEG